MSDSTHRLILIDGSSFLFRAYYGVPILTNTPGYPTHAIYGVANMLRKLLAVYNTDYFVVVFDAKGKNFRHELYPNYKANRPPMPEDLRQQIQPLHQLIQAMGLPLISIEGVEADDVLGTLATQAAASGFEVIIATSDKDMAQLVNSQIILEDTLTEKRLDRTGVIDKFGVTPEQMIDFLALMGDKSDNIPGIPSVGEKTAAKWLKQYHDLDNLIANAEKIKGKVGEHLRAHIAQLAINRQLTTIRCDLRLNYSLDDLKRQPENTELLIEILAEFDFKSWLTQFKPQENNELIENDNSAIIVDYQTINTEYDLDQWIEKMITAKMVAIDTETSSLNYMEAELVGISIAVEIGIAAYIPLAHNYVEVPSQLNREFVLAKLKPLLENPEIVKIGQNLKYDKHIFANYGIDLSGIKSDTMLASYVLNSTATRHNLEDLATYYLQMKTLSYETLTGKGVNQIPFSEVTIEQATDYAAEDADMSLRLHYQLKKQLLKIPKLYAVYHQLEIPLIAVLQRMERQGVLIDCQQLIQQSIELSQQMITIEQQAHQLAGQIFNLNSPKQIQTILYEQLQLPIIKKTPKGQPSTEESVLQELAINYPLPQLILNYRSLTKLKSTYTDKLPQQIHQSTQRIHTSYHQAITATGRLSSSEPNLQNIPIRSENGRKIRQAFIAPKGCYIVAADYSQIELRIMAHLSADKHLLAAFAKGQDIHTATAAEIFKMEIDQVTPNLRRSAKAINFGLIYGMSAFGLAQQLGLDQKQAQAYIDLYFDRYPQVKQYMESTRKLAQQQGYVETIFGRRLYLPNIRSKNPAIRQATERMAINAPMQGTAADIIKKAMIAVDHWIQTQSPNIKMIMQVHDELVFEIQEPDLAFAIDKIRQFMTGVVKLSVPLIVDIGYGYNWDQAH
ncbi:MAG: polymerase [Pseudomonadota bacterium]